MSKQMGTYQGLHWGYTGITQINTDYTVLISTVYEFSHCTKGHESAASFQGLQLLESMRVLS